SAAKPASRAAYCSAVHRGPGDAGRESDSITTSRPQLVVARAAKGTRPWPPPPPLCHILRPIVPPILARTAGLAPVTACPHMCAHAAEVVEEREVAPGTAHGERRRLERPHAPARRRL